MKSSLLNTSQYEIDEMIKDELGADVFCLPPSGYDYNLTSENNLLHPSGNCPFSAKKVRRYA